MKSGVVVGILGHEVVVEVHCSHGLPGMRLVGLAGAAVREAGERVRSALVNSGFTLPPRKIVVNLAPADLPKTAPHFDLPIAIGVALSLGLEQRLDRFRNYWMIGEVSLTGAVSPVCGALPLALAAAEAGAAGIITPKANADEAMAAGLPVIPVGDINEALLFLSGKRPIASPLAEAPRSSSRTLLDFSDIRGQAPARRAIEVAAAGRHNLLMTGPPGSGKSMMAKRLPSILPEMSRTEALEVTRVHSVRGRTRAGGGLVTERPFRAPHHTISAAGLVGGGHPLAPGELSLGHRGVLFLDEMAQFGPRLLQTLRQPLESKEVTIARAGLSLTFPADFMLIGTRNPCPFGYHGDDLKDCTCSPGKLEAYHSRLSGPLLDRIDIHVRVARLRRDEMLNERPAEPSNLMLARVVRARNQQFARLDSLMRTNADMNPTEVREYCQLESETKAWLGRAIEGFSLTARGCDRLLKVARTVADLAGADMVAIEHLAEAAQYRAVVS